MRFGQLGRRNRHRGRSGNGNLRYVDDTTVIAGTKEDLIQIMERIRKTCEKAGLYLNVLNWLNTKVMTTVDIGHMTVDRTIVAVWYISRSSHKRETM